MKRVLLPLFVVCLVAASYWLSQKSTQMTQLVKSAGTTDYEVEQLELVQFHPDGTIKQTLTSPKVLHFLADGSTLLASPKMTVYARKDESPWLINAESARLNEQQTQLLLKGQVDINQAMYKDRSDIHISTKDLTIYPKKNYAQSAAVTRAQQGNNWVNATGIEIWFDKERRIKFANNVTAFYKMDR